MKQHFYKLYGKQHSLLYIFINHSTLSQSELNLLMSVLDLSYDVCERKNKLAFDCTFQRNSFKRKIVTDFDHD